MHSNKENIQIYNKIRNKIKALNADVLQKKEESATIELDKVFSLYSENLIPKAEALIVNQLQVDALMEKRIRVEETQIK